MCSYTYSCGVLTSVPAGATVLIQAAEQDSFIAGCCLNENGTPIDGFVEAIALERDGMDLTSLPTPSTTAPTSRTTTAM